MRTAQATTAAGRTLLTVLRAVLSLLVLACAVAGLPVLLAWAIPVVWAAGHDDLAHLLDRQDTGAAFLVLLVAVGWAGWAQFTFCALRELLAQLRGRTWHAPRGLGASQRAAALLIGSILVLLPAGSALATPASATPAQSAPRLPQQTPSAHTTTADHAAAAHSRNAGQTSTYTVREVRPAESLWSIAEGELGDGERWRDIAALNEGCTMTDGQVFRSNSFLQPGWQLHLPAATSLDDHGAAPAGGARTQLADSARADTGESEPAATVTVQPGDYLSKIAEEELGDGNQWPDLFKASHGTPQPGGLPPITDPDVIYAGQRVTVPGAQPNRSDPPQDDEPADGSRHEQRTPPATEHPDSGQGTGNDKETQAPAPTRSAPKPAVPDQPSSQPTQQPGPGQGAPSAAPQPSASAGVPSTSPSAPGESSASGAPSPATAASDTPASSPAGHPLQLRTVLGAGALLAAAVTGALALRRLLQRRRRKPGETIAIAPETSSAEATLAAAAEPAAATQLDLALRSLARQLAKDGDRQLPALRAARIGARSLEVLPEDLAQEPQAPFTAGRAGWWTWPDDADVLDDEAARQVPAPYPALVTLGSTNAGDLLLLNLARLPALLLDGNAVHITEVCTSLALEFGMSPWASDVEVVTVGFGEDLPQLLPTSRIAHMRQPAHALRDLTERLLEAHQLPEAGHQPYLLLCASPLNADLAWQFADVIDKAERVPVTLIAPASDAAPHFPHAEILNASLSEPQQLNCIGAEITLQRLEHAAYQQITTALAVSGQSADPAEGPWKQVPREPYTERRPRPPEPAEQARLGEGGEAAPASPVAAHTSGRDIFPALPAASTDPAGLRLLPVPKAPTEAPAGPEEEAEKAPEEAALEEVALEEVAKVSGPDDAAGDTGEDAKTQDLHTPEIRVLGPVEVSGVASTGHGPSQARLAALLYFRPGRSADVLCADMDPVSPWSAATLNARMQGLRRALGNDPAGHAYVPRRRTGDDPYRLAESVRCDWTRFTQLAERALPHGPAGLADLEKALGLVRGRPFGPRALPWAEPHQQEMITRIIDVAHTVATLRTPPGPHHDLTSARRAIATGLEADESAELLYRDWIRIEHTAGNRAGVHTAITRIQQINRALDCSLEMETEQLINHFLHPTDSRQAHGL
jgi:nucleoid-associated protein YgaU